MSVSVLVTDGEQRAALATVRSLGAAGHAVHVCSTSPGSIAGSSRHCSSHTRVADPLTDSGGFVDDLLRATKSCGARVVLPVSEAALLAVLPARARFDAVIPFAAASAFVNICDKRRVLAAAARHDIAVPAQIALTDAADSALLIDASMFPVVLKPSRSVAGNDGERIRTGVSYAANADELREALGRIPAAAYPVLAQQRVEGPGFAISVLIWDGELRAAFAHERIREKPPSGGVSVLRKSIPADPELLEKSLLLLRDFDWHGVAMVEFKLDTRTGIPYLMEINGRLWGSLQLAIDAGVDFPLLLVNAALDKKPGVVPAYEPNVRSRWEWGDFDHLLASLFHSPRTLALPIGGARPERLKSLSEFFRSFGPGDRAEVFRRDDPVPFLRETVKWFRRQ